jgi:hypothetical protein
LSKPVEEGHKDDVLVTEIGDELKHRSLSVEEGEGK